MVDLVAPGVGVPHLEKLLSPLPSRAQILVANDPGIEAEPFLYQSAFAQLEAGGHVVYVVTNRPPATVLSAMLSLGLDIEPHRTRFHFVDAFSPLMGAASIAEHLVGEPEDPAHLADVLERVAHEHPKAHLVVDSLSTVVDQAREGTFARAYPRLRDAMRRFAFAEVLFTRWPYGTDIQRVVSDFDAVVAVHGVEDRVMTGQYFVVERAAWKPGLAPKPRLFKTLKPGGVHVYVPKIVITGPFNAGKSSFVHAVSDIAVSVDQLGTTVALDHGQVTMDGLTADIFGTPGQARFDPILRIVAGQALGVIVVVDSTKPDSFARAKEMLHQTWRQGLPAIIAANKQDLPDALPATEVARLLDPPPRVKVVACRGSERDSARAVLQELLDQILSPEVIA